MSTQVLGKSDGGKERRRVSSSLNHSVSPSLCREFISPRAAYIHVPFCRHRCGYCNFTLVAGRDDLVGAFLDALERELSGLAQPHEVDTLFFGGGTPTHLSPQQMERLFSIVRRWLPVAAGGEFS